MADLTTGANAEGYEAFCDDIYNDLKNNWRQADPCSLAGLTAGMIVSDSADDKLYHAILASGCMCSEIVQTCVPVSDDEYVEFGDTISAFIGYNSTNEALMLGIPVDPNLGFIICEGADVLADMTGEITATGFPQVNIMDLDLDSRIEFSFTADDKPTIMLKSGAYYSLIQESQAEGLVGADLRIGLDETNRTLILCDRGDINNDFGLAAATHPTLHIYQQLGTTVGFLDYHELNLNSGFVSLVYISSRARITGRQGTYFVASAARAAGNVYEFSSANGITDTNGQQSWMYLDPIVNQSLTAAFDGIYLNATLNSLGDGSTGDGNNLLRLAIAATTMYRIDTDGIIHNKRVGDLMTWTYQGDLADDATFNLPAFTDSCWGFIQAGNNEEYALFTVDDDGDVTLISNSANVVANADTDGKICLGIASPEEPLTVKNRLGAQKNINLIIWYS